MAGPIEFTDEVLGAGVNRARLSLVGRLLCSSHPSRIRVQHAANNIWAKRAAVTVLDAGYGLFQLVFANEEDYQDALSKAPWFIQSKILTLKKWEKPTPQLFLDLARVPYPVQLWDLPEEYRTVALGRLLASRLGPVEEAAMYAVWDNPGCVFKAKVLIDVSAPLEHRLEARKRANDGSVGPTFWVSLRYENIKSVCFRCRRIGHNQRNCTFDLIPGGDGFGPEVLGERTGPKLNENSYAAFRNGGRPRGNVWRKGGRPGPRPVVQPRLQLEAPPPAANSSEAAGQSLSRVGTNQRNLRANNIGGGSRPKQMGKIRSGPRLLEKGDAGPATVAAREAAERGHKPNNGLSHTQGPLCRSRANESMVVSLNQCGDLARAQPNDGGNGLLLALPCAVATPLQIQEPSASYGLGNLFCDEDPGFLYEEMGDSHFFLQGGSDTLNKELQLDSDSAVSCSPIGVVTNGQSRGKAILVESSGSPKVYVRRNAGICIQEPEDGVVESGLKRPRIEVPKNKGIMVEVASPKWPQVDK
ncbi:unnamed protein product [Linum trigynum]|uniref:CCHC-type domain-containing protein n=1 Tax=Linum trigynum TaxID=586398 RepID=A0AAV2GFN6_9ROSI